MATPENPMAFPVAFPVGTQWSVAPGMTLRDYFAGQVAPAVLTQLWANLKENDEMVDNCYKVASEASYEMADAMLAARSAEVDA